MNLLKALEQLERLKPDPAQTFSERIDAYRRMAWPKPRPISAACRRHLQERCRRIGRPPGIGSTGKVLISRRGAGVADWEAREADQLTRMRLVEHFTSVSGHYISDRPDTALPRCCCWWRKRSAGSKTSPGRVSPASAHNGWRCSRTALPVRPRLNQYRSNRREAMQVFMQDLEQLSLP